MSPFSAARQHRVHYSDISPQHFSLKLLNFTLFLFSPHLEDTFQLRGAWWEVTNPGSQVLRPPPPPGSIRLGATLDAASPPCILAGKEAPKSCIPSLQHPACTKRVGKMLFGDQAGLKSAN